MRGTWLAALALACGGTVAEADETGHPPTQGTYEAETFVQDAAFGWCGAVRDCEPGTWQGAYGGDQTTCLDSERTRWRDGLAAMPCALDVAAAATCVNSLATTSCEAWEAGTTQARCEAVTTCP